MEMDQPEESGRTRDELLMVMMGGGDDRGPFKRD